MLVPWKLLRWARDNRVTRLRWLWCEVEFVQTAETIRVPSPSSGGPLVTPAAAPSRTPEEEAAEHERILLHSGG